MMQHPSIHARTAPGRPAVVMGSTGSVETYRDLDRRSNQVAHLLRGLGLGLGDHVAVLLENRVEFLEVAWGALRSGMYATPINWHLTPAETAYIVNDCGASVLIGSADLLAALGDEPVAVPADRRLTVPDDYEGVLSAQPGGPVDGECEGHFMFYSSGTTGRPKGVKPPDVGEPLGTPTSFTGLMGTVFGFDGASVYLSPAPLYHAAPAGWSTGVHRLGGTAVIMDRFDPVETLRLIQQHRVTHVQFVPTHMIRLLELPAGERSRYDLSSLRYVIHAAAPCPPDVKRAFIEWVGPIVHEYYSGSEGVGFCVIDSEQWLTHPGSVGRSMLGAAHILDDSGREVPVGEEGEVWFETPRRFEYHGDADKTAAAFNDRGWSSLGDVGRLDGDGYLYLTDRVSNMIISGGVNIYPREIEDVLVGHPAVADAAVIGVPHPRMGEAVRAVVLPAAPPEDPDALAGDVIAWCRERISAFKCPTSVAFVDDLPRLPTGKLAKRLLDDRVRQPFTGDRLAR